MSNYFLQYTRRYTIAAPNGETENSSGWGNGADGGHSSPETIEVTSYAWVAKIGEQAGIVLDIQY